MKRGAVKENEGLQNALRKFVVVGGGGCLLDRLAAACLTCAVVLASATSTPSGNETSTTVLLTQTCSASLSRMCHQARMQLCACRTFKISHLPMVRSTEVSHYAYGHPINGRDIVCAGQYQLRIPLVFPNFVITKPTLKDIVRPRESAHRVTLRDPHTTRTLIVFLSLTS